MTKARTRRAALDADRKARDARIDSAVVDHYLALDQRAEGQRLIAQADAADATAIVCILNEGLSVGQVADLTELNEQHVKRLKTQADRSASNEQTQDAATLPPTTSPPTSANRMTDPL